MAIDTESQQEPSITCAECGTVTGSTVAPVCSACAQAMVGPLALALAEARAALRAGAEDARDAARYRWLREVATNTSADVDHVEVVFWRRAKGHITWGNALDTAIDAAMSDQNKGKV